MTRSAKAALFLFSLVALLAGAQSSTQDQNLMQQTQARGYWVDSSTGLMWAAKDNGQNITWKKAMRYCRNLQLAGYSDWKLPTIDQLHGIYDGSGFNAPVPRKGMEWALAGKPKGDLLLTGAREWSSGRVLDDRGRRTGYAWEYDFPHGRRWKDPLGYSGQLRALCVREN